MSLFTRICPTCSKETAHSSERSCKQADRSGKPCKECGRDASRKKCRSEEFRAAHSKRISDAWAAPDSAFQTTEYRKKLTEAQLSRSPETYVGASLSQKEAWFRERKDPTGRLERMREANRRDDVRQKRSQGLKKMYEAHPEKCEAHALRAKARMEDPDYKRRCTISMISASRRTGGTSRQEKELASVLSEFGFEHKRDFGDMQVDFYNPETDTAVEYYGTWWHCHQSTIKRITKDYNGVHPVIQKTPNQIMQEDFERVEKLKKFVEHVVIIWEYDVFDGKKFDKQAISNILSSTSGAWR